MSSQTTKLILKTIEILILSDSSVTAEEIASSLKAQFKINWQRVETKAHYNNALNKRWDLILYDAELTQLNLSEAIDCLSDKNLEIPLIVVNGESNIPSAVAAIKVGATDYIPLGAIAQLPLAIAKSHQESSHHLQTEISTETQLSTLITENADGIVVVGDRGRVRFVNPAASKLLGKSPAELIDRPLGFSVENSDYLEVNLPLGSAKTIVQMRVNPIQWQKTNAHIVSLRDITQLKQTEAKQARFLKERATNRAQRQLLAVLSYELRIILSPILGWSQLMRGGHLNKSQIQKAATTIERNIELQTRLIENIADISSKITDRSKLQLSSVDLNATTKNVLNSLRAIAQAKSIEIATDLAENMGLFRGDWLLLQQLVKNLLSHTIKITPSGGTINISLASVEGEVPSNNHLEIANFPQSYLRLHIANTACRNTSAFLPHVLDDFSTTEETKEQVEAQLDLAIAQCLVELHEGEIKVINLGLDRGATITVFLPLTETKTKATSEKSVVPRPQNLVDVRIMIVDDDRATRKLLQFLLQGEGARVFTANSATEALAAIEQFQPDLLISDLEMPSMNGRDLIAKVKAIAVDREIKAIAISGYVSEQDKQNSLAAGFDLHLNKPLNVSNFVETVARLINTRT